MELIDQLWDFNDPASSEARFRQAMAGVPSTSDRLQLLTQLARAQGLQRNFAAAHATLDQVQVETTDSDSVVLIRVALERGRLHNSEGQGDVAGPYFESAWRLAGDHGHDALAVDAAHMLAIVAVADDSLMWSQRALALAASSDDPYARRWVASLHNNIGWTHHGRGDFDTAFQHFQHALEARRQQDKPRDVLVARWCIARCLRSLSRIEEALAEQQALLKAWNELGEADGYVHEELAECLQAMGKADEAQEHRDRARELLEHT